VTWLLLLSVLSTGHVTTIHLDGVDEAACMREGAALAAIIERGADVPVGDHVRVVCVPSSPAPRP
jgi:hypothetical protein